ncbi:hypothetical protein B0H14DRAFT_3725679 [Mycena olivaceomarginata]|nr:hypothetical protein B0H14DRAFT_3725679 [Mycena olivaceomarginata]
MHHKRNLTLVSKQWNQYAQLVLYSFVWLARAAQAKALALTLLCQAWTPALERCNPADLRGVLAYAPALEVGALRGLSWTNYDDPALVGLGVGLGHMGGRLEYLELNFVSSAESPAKVHFDLAMGGAGAEALSLPALKTLKVALDNATFAVLSTWDLPALRNLTVLSADFSYASAGFRRFFAVHGVRLRQLELGHSSAHIEEHYLTAPPAGANGGGAALGLGLAEWCPHLEEFVCSADAAWDWQHPDWIALHQLLSAHPNVMLIGIRGIDARLWDGDAAFFGLRAQVESLLRREAFPHLRCVQDLRAGSDVLRRGRGGMRVVKFWEEVLERFRREQVWLEDWRGWNVTSESLRRARVAAGEVA